MNPCELNALVAAITNQLYCTLDKDEFVCLSVFLNELSKSMFSMALFRDICDKGNKKRHPPKKVEVEKGKKA